MNKKPNILWIMTDQQSYNMLSCTGNKYVYTPNMDELASNGVRFERTYCTNPVCGPSRISLFTGIYPNDIGIRSNSDKIGRPPQEILDNGIGHLLQKQGYKAVYGGKEHFLCMRAEDLGFEYLCKDERDVLADTVIEYIRQYDWEKPLFMVTSFINPHDICLMAITDAFRNEEEKKRWIKWEDAIAEVENAQKLPQDISEEEFYRTVCPPLPENYEPALDEPEAIDILLAERNFRKMARENYSDERWRIHRWAYTRLTQLVDAQIGRVLDVLRESGQWDNTLIIFTSDHGDMDASHKMEHKSVLYEEACHVPLIIKGPGQTEGRIDKRLVCNGLDLLKTVMDYAQIPSPEYLRGKSLRAVVEENSKEILHDHIVIECENGIGVVSDRYKYVLYDKGARMEQFYDLKVNPGEMYNQIDQECYAEEVERFRRIIREHQSIQYFT